MATPGVVPDMSGRNSPIDFFRLFFDDKVMDLIFTETTICSAVPREGERVFATTPTSKGSCMGERAVDIEGTGGVPCNSYCHGDVVFRQSGMFMKPPNSNRHTHFYVHIVHFT